MRGIMAITLLALAAGVHSSVIRTETMCVSIATGQHIPNPADCSSYYVCNFGFASLVHCDDGLLYDVGRKVCNWADNVSCGQVIDVNPEEASTEAASTEAASTEAASTEVASTTTAESIPTAATSAPLEPELGSTSNPLTTINFSNGVSHWPGVIYLPDSNRLYCTRENFYFVPHMTDCGRYYICESGRIHLHQCGEGIHWNYIFAQCDYPEKAFCFANANLTDVQPVSTTWETTTPLITTVWTSELTERPTTVQTTTPVTTTTSELTERPTTTVTTASPVPYPICPEGNDAVFFPHLTDCSRYYMCVSGLAIPTKCPAGYYWDVSENDCNIPALAKCNAIEI